MKNIPKSNMIRCKMLLSYSYNQLLTCNQIVLRKSGAGICFVFSLSLLCATSNHLPLSHLLASNCYISVHWIMACIETFRQIFQFECVGVVCWLLFCYVLFCSWTMKCLQVQVDVVIYRHILIRLFIHIEMYIRMCGYIYWQTLIFIEIKNVLI